jgi:hypothetical protein
MTEEQRIRGAQEQRDSEISLRLTPHPGPLPRLASLDEPELHAGERKTGRAKMLRRFPLHL